MTLIIEELSNTTVTEAIEANQVGYLADLGRAPQVELHDTSEMLWFVTGMPYARLNRVLKAQVTSDSISEKIESVISSFSARKAPFLWHLGPSTRPLDLGQHLLKHGLHYLGDEMGMAADLLKINHKLPTLSLLTIERASSIKRLREWSQIFTTSFGMSEDAAQVFFSIEAGLEQTTYRHLFVGYRDKRPVGVATLFLGAGAAGIFGVGTVPAARRQGIGTAMTLYLLSQARTIGYRIATLNASPMGAEIYRRLGFKGYCTLSRYASSLPGLL